MIKYNLVKHYNDNNEYSMNYIILIIIIILLSNSK